MSDITAFQSVVTSIGRAELKRDGVALAIAEQAVARGFDFTARGAVAEAIRQHGGWSKETCPARTTGKKGEQKVTAFGVGFSALESAITRLVREQKAPESGVIRVSLSGEGGVTVTLRPGDAGYETFAHALEHLQSEQENAADNAA